MSDRGAFACRYKSVLTGWPCALWLILASLYVLQTPPAQYSSGFQERAAIVHTIRNERRLPIPGESSESGQPPLYPVLCSLLLPSSPRHVLAVRLLSVACGTLFLVLMLRQLAGLGIRSSARTASALLLSTTPAFFFVFTAYSADALATLLSGCILYLSEHLGQTWNRTAAIWLALVTVAGVYTRYSVATCVGAVLLWTVWQCAKQRLPVRGGLRLLGVFAVAGACFAPWLVRNQVLPREVVRRPSEVAAPIPNALLLSKPALNVVLTPPGLTNGEWDDPYVHLQKPLPIKKGSYLAALISTSLFGEARIRGAKSFGPWLALWCHVALFLWAVRNSLVSSATRNALVLLLAGVGLLVPALLLYPSAALMDFRLMAWAWLPLAVLYAHLPVLGQTTSGRRDFLCPLLLGVGLLAQAYLYCVLISVH
jgi:hypothetical protein